MDRRVKPSRLAASACLGFVPGLFLWMVLPMPHVPQVEPFHASRDTLHASYGVIRDRGIETKEGMAARILFVGDIMLDRNVALRMKRAKDPAYAFRKLPADWFNSFDYAVANLEGVVTDKRRAPVKSIDFQFDPSVVGTLKEQGIDAVSQANNHALDQGSVGYADSVRRLAEGGILVFGHQVDDGAISLATTMVNGLRISFLGYNTTDNPLDRTQAEPIIKQAASSSDIVIAYLHWGAEYRDRPDVASIELAHWLIDQGVSIVIGGHPHWSRGVSSYKGHPIVWSLGNFIFDQDWSVETRLGLAVELDLRKDATTINLFPIAIEKSQPAIMDGVARQQRLDRLANVSDPELREQVRAGKIKF